ncbi:hypothetical protein F2Q68_00012293, partial [Brassica cretica]
HMNMDTSNKNGFSIFHGFLMMFLSLQLQEVCSDRIFTNQSLSGYQTIVSSGYVYELDLFTPEPEDWVASLLRDNDYVAMGDGLTSTSTKLWQSFDVPQCLSSWNSIKDPSPGHYSLKVDHKTRNTLIVMVSNGSKSCWSSGPCYVSDQRCMVYSYGGSFRLCNGKTSQVSCECIPNFARDRNFPLQNIQIKSERSQYFVSMSMSWSFEGMNNQSQMRLENKGATKHYKTATIVLASVLTSVAAAAFLVGSCCCYFSSRRRTRAQKGLRLIFVEAVFTIQSLFIFVLFFCLFTEAEAESTETEDGGGEEMCELSLHTIIRATNGFSEDYKIGEGGFGPVYKVPKPIFNGYMSAEYGWGGIISEKSDIYSFGVLLLEIISGKKANKFVHNDHNSLINYYASTIPDCTISLFQSVIKLFQIYEFFDCKYQLAYQRSRSAQPKLADCKETVWTSARKVPVCTSPHKLILLVLHSTHQKFKAYLNSKNPESNELMFKVKPKICKP